MKLPKIVWGLLIVVVSLLPASAAPAHNTPDYYQAKWAPPWDIPWEFTEGFPDGAMRARVADGFRAWNENNEPLQWVQSPTDVPDFDSFVCPQPARRNGVHWRNIGFALASWCLDPSGNLLATQIIIDSSGTNWWTSVDPVPTTHYDVWSATSQEVGHATGFLRGGAVNNPGHWPEENATLCPDPGADNYLDRHTMCEGLWNGTRVQRFPADHDDHTFGGAYNEPAEGTGITVPNIRLL
jgi:hypothetical protein